MNENRDERLKEVVREVAAEFLSREANRDTLITVTRTDLSQGGKHCNIFISVLPESRERAALGFANRHRGEFSDYYKKKIKGMPPQVEFMLDFGEKNRQRLDELSE